MSSFYVSPAFRNHAPRRSESNATSSRLPYSPTPNESDSIHSSIMRVKGSRPSTGHQSAHSVRSVKQFLEPFPEDLSSSSRRPPGDKEEYAVPEPPLEATLLPSPPLTRVGTGDSLRGNSSQHRATADGVEDDNDRTRVGEADLNGDLETWNSVQSVELVDGERTFNRGSTIEDGGTIDHSEVVSANIAQPNSPSALTPATHMNALRKTLSSDLLEKNGMTTIIDDENGDIVVNGEKYAPARLKEMPVLKNQPRKLKPPRSSYYFGPPPEGSIFGTNPVGQIGVHYPREIIRVERDYSAGDLPQFSASYPLELEGRISPSQFMENMTAINEILESAYSISWACFDNTIAVFTFYLSRLIFSFHYDRELRKMRQLIHNLNVEIYNPLGLNILWPRDAAFLFLEIEYYVSELVESSDLH